jgi:hypothetical protein
MLAPFGKMFSECACQSFERATIFQVLSSWQMCSRKTERERAVLMVLLSRFAEQFWLHLLVFAFIHVFWEKPFRIRSFPTTHHHFRKEASIMGKGCCIKSSTILLFHNAVALISETVSKLLAWVLLQLSSSLTNFLWSHEP